MIRIVSRQQCQLFILYTVEVPVDIDIDDQHSSRVCGRRQRRQPTGHELHNDMQSITQADDLERLQTVPSYMRQPAHKHYCHATFTAR